MAIELVKNSLYNSSGRPLDGLYGPWSSWEELYASINNVELSSVTEKQVSKMKSQFQQGLTVALIEDGSVVEYWKPYATVSTSTNGGFVVKSPDVEVSDSDIAEAVSDYFAENPPTGVPDDKIADAVNDYLDSHPSTNSVDKDGASLLYYLAA